MARKESEEMHMELKQMDNPSSPSTTRWRHVAQVARTCLASAALLVLGLSGGVQAQVGAQVSLPNGYVTTQGATLPYASSGGGSGARGSGSGSGGGSGVSSGGVSSGAGLRWDGREWAFGSQWDSLSQTWKNLTGSNTADTTGALGSTSSGGEPGCWVWVDEDWQPSPEMVTIGGVSKPVTVNGVVQMQAVAPIRTTPFNLSLIHI